MATFCDYSANSLVGERTSTWGSLREGSIIDSDARQNTAVFPVPD